MLNLKEFGYYANKKTQKIISSFENAGKQTLSSIPTLLLTGSSGSGKTYLAECFAKAINAKLLIVQCYPCMNADNFIYEPNIAAIIQKNSQNAIKDGILVKALKNTKNNDSSTVVLIDELDKANEDTDSFLLDFINSGRVTNGQDEWNKGNGNIWIFLTSNAQRDLQEALLNRCRKLEIERPSKEAFLEILGLPKDHYLGLIYKKVSYFSIRQARNYLIDLENLNTPFDKDVLSQYVDLNHIKIKSLYELESFSSYVDVEFLFDDDDDDDIDDDIDDIDDEQYYPSVNIHNKLKIYDSKYDKWKQLLLDKKGRFLKFDYDHNATYVIHFSKLSEMNLLSSYKLLSDNYSYQIAVDDELMHIFDTATKYSSSLIGIYIFQNKMIIKYWIYKGNTCILISPKELKELYEHIGVSLITQEYKEPEKEKEKTEKELLYEYIHDETTTNLLYLDKFFYDYTISKFLANPESLTFKIKEDAEGRLFIEYTTISDVFHLCSVSMFPSQYHVEHKVILDNIQLFDDEKFIKRVFNNKIIISVPWTDSYYLTLHKVKDKIIMYESGDRYIELYKYLKEEGYDFEN